MIAHILKWLSSRASNQHCACTSWRFLVPVATIDRAANRSGGQRQSTSI